MTVCTRFPSVALCIALLVGTFPADALGAERLIADPGGGAGRLPAAPTGLRALAGDGSVTLSWDNPGDPSITHYEYRMREAPPAAGWGSRRVVPGSHAETTDFTVKGLANGTEYRFKLYAVNADGASRPAPLDDPWYVAATSVASPVGADYDGRSGMSRAAISPRAMPPVSTGWASREE